MLLETLLDAADFVSLSVCRAGHEWQANLRREVGGGWRVCHGATPSEALSQLFAGVLPPPDAPLAAVVPPPPPPY